MVTTNIPILLESRATGNSLQIVDRCYHFDLRKYFCNRITNIWNSLPEDIVTATSVNCFNKKAVLSEGNRTIQNCRLDKHWFA